MSLLDRSLTLYLPSHLDSPTTLPPPTPFKASQQPDNHHPTAIRLISHSPIRTPLPSPTPPPPPPLLPTHSRGLNPTGPTWVDCADCDIHSRLQFYLPSSPFVFPFPLALHKSHIVVASPPLPPLRPVHNFLALLSPTAHSPAAHLLLPPVLAPPSPPHSPPTPRTVGAHYPA